MRECDVLNAIMLKTSDRVDWMRNNVGVAQYPNGSVVPYGCGGPGGSDLIGCERGTGRMVCCEVKSQTGRVRPEQETFLRRMRDSGAVAFVARSVDDVIEALA